MMPVVEPNGTPRIASKATATQATVEVLGMAEMEAEAVIFSGEQVRKSCNLHNGDGVGSSTWIVRKSVLVFNGFSSIRDSTTTCFGFFHSAGISQIRHLKGLQMHFHDSVVYENGSLLSSLLQRRKAGTCNATEWKGLID